MMVTNALCSPSVPRRSGVYVSRIVGKPTNSASSYVLWVPRTRSMPYWRWRVVDSAEAVELAEVAADAVDGVLAHVAGVEDDEVGFFVGLDLCVSGVQDHAPHPVGVVDVHLAAKGTDAGGPGPLGPGGRPGAARARLARDRDLCRDWRRFCGVTQSLPPARRCGPSPRSLPDGSRAEVPLSLGSSPAPPA